MYTLRYHFCVDRNRESSCVSPIFNVVASLKSKASIPQSQHLRPPLIQGYAYTFNSKKKDALRNISYSSFNCTLMMIHDTPLHWSYTTSLHKYNRHSIGQGTSLLSPNLVANIKSARLTSLTTTQNIQRPHSTAHYGSTIVLPPLPPHICAITTNTLANPHVTNIQAKTIASSHIHNTTGLTRDKDFREYSAIATKTLFSIIYTLKGDITQTPTK